MSRAKELKTSPEFNVNMFELFSLFSPDKKTKYTETLLRVMKKTPNLDEHCNEVIEYLSNEYGISKDELTSIPKLQLIFFYRLVDGMFNGSDLKTFQKFCEYNERGLIKQNDMSTYQSFEDINNATSLAEISASNKDLEKQVKVVYEDEEWLFIRPLTFNASKKYGANTKWCTTTESNPEYFIKYSSKGVLIYCLNKKTGYKVASFRSLDKNDPEFSWWNQKDSRIDSLQSELPDELLKIIRNESLKDAKTNRFLLGEAERIKEDKLLSKYSSYRHMEPIDLVEPQAEERINRIRRAMERNEDELTPTNDITEEPYEVRRLVEAYAENETESEPQRESYPEDEQPTQSFRSGSFN
jgi:hypothetical protein